MPSFKPSDRPLALLLAGFFVFCICYPVAHTIRKHQFDHCMDVVKQYTYADFDTRWKLCQAIHP